jgi:hypothetical protein
MTVSKIKLAAATILLGAASAAQAGFVAYDNYLPGKQTFDIVSNNEFKDVLKNTQGVTTYTLGATLGVDVAGSITYYYYGKEAGFKNVFSSDAGSYDSGYSPTTQNFFGGNGIKIGNTIDVGPGALNFGFCAFAYPGIAQGCKSNGQNDRLEWGDPQSIAFNILGNTAWLFWDDSGAGPDDNHDDMLIKAVFTPKAVPEPATLGLLGLGLLGTWVGSRRRLRKA